LSTSLSEFRPGFPQPTSLSGEDSGRVAEIVATVGAVYQHGCIYFGVCNNRLKIEAIEGALEKSLRAKGITISRVVLAERFETDAAPQYRAKISDPITYLSEQQDRESTLFFVHGLPELIRAETQGDYSKVAPVSQLLNYRRELFHDRALCAFFWLDPETIPYLRQNARDFWAFRSGTAFFQEAEAPADGRQVAAPASLRGHFSSSIEAGGLRQEREPTTRWSGDLDEKLTQLAAYRRKSPPDDNAIGNLLLDIGRLHAQKHESERALATLHEALAIFERLALEDKVRDAKMWLARAFEDAGRLDKAEKTLREAIEIDERLGNEPSLAADYSNLSGIYQARGQLEEAEKWLYKAIEIDERLRNEPNLAIDYNNLSQIYDARGQLEEAEKWLHRAIGISERLRDEPNLAIDYNNLSQVFQDRGKLDDAENWLHRAIGISERLRDEPNLAIDYSNLSQIYKARGRLDEAEKWLRRAIEIVERLGDEPHLATSYNNLSQIYLARGQLGEAEKWLRKAIGIDERLGDEPSLAIDYNNLSGIYRARGQLEEAEKWLRKAISLMEPKGPSAILDDLRQNLDALLKERQHHTAPES